MPYIGKNPVGGGFHKLDNLTASATDTYALTLGSAAYYPESANQLLVSLNGVIQAPQDSFTVSGSNLVFDSALTASDSIDFVVALGDVLAVKTVTDGAITTAKLGNGAVTDAKIDTMAASKLTGTINSARFPSGSIIQIQYDQLTTSTTQTIATADTYTKLTNFPSVTITPVSTSSKLKIDVMWNGEFGNANNQYNNAFVLYRDSTLIKGNTDTGGHVTTGMWAAANSYNAGDADSTPETMNGTYYDEPSTTNAITYYLGVTVSTVDTFYINRVVNASTLSGYERLISSMTVTEIAG